MSGSHGELFDEIGKLVFAAQAGQAVDLAAKSEELTQRYATLGVSQEILEKIISRSVGAISFSMARVSMGEHGPAMHPALDGAIDSEAAQASASRVKTLFPSGVSLAVLS